MAILVQQVLNEMGFCEFYEKNLLNKNTASFDLIKEAGSILGREVDVTCGSCARYIWQDLLNVYNSLLPKYEEYKASKLEPVYTKYEAEVEKVVNKKR